MPPDRPAGVRVPGDIARGTQEADQAPPTPAKPGSSQEFAAAQAFGDPVHREAAALESASEEE
jgi:hypothetical protein